MPDQTPAATGSVDGPADRAVALVRAGRVTEALTALGALAPTTAAGAALGRDDRVRLTAAALECRLARGDLAEAMTLGDQLGDQLADLVAAPSGGTGTTAAVARHAQGELASAMSDPELATTHFLAAGDLVDDGAEHLLEVPWRAGAALAMVRAGRRAEAAVLAREHLAAARACGSAYVVAGALRTSATADPGGSPVTLLRQARAALEGVPAARLAAQVDTDLAGLLLLTAEPSAAAEALALLRSAEEYAGRQELWPLQGRVRRLLDRLGEPPRRVQSEALAALTASERRVARLAADGLTNRQIAEQLVVTVKAVEWHLSHVYRKLGISSRSRLAGTLGAPV